MLELSVKTWHKWTQSQLSIHIQVVSINSKLLWPSNASHEIQHAFWFYDVQHEIKDDVKKLLTHITFAMCWHIRLHHCMLYMRYMLIHLHRLSANISHLTHVKFLDFIHVDTCKTVDHIMQTYSSTFSKGCNPQSLMWQKIVWNPIKPNYMDGDVCIYKIHHNANKVQSFEGQNYISMTFLPPYIS